jgi:hypothetical protein
MKKILILLAAAVLLAGCQAFQQNTKTLDDVPSRERRLWWDQHEFWRPYYDEDDRLDVEPEGPPEGQSIDDIQEELERRD